MAPRNPPSPKQLALVQKHLAQLKQQIASLATAATALQPPTLENAAAKAGYLKRADEFPGSIQSVLSAWMELLFATLPEKEAKETAASAKGYLNEDMIIKSLIPTARTRVLGSPPRDPNYVPDMIDKYG